MIDLTLSHLDGLEAQVELLRVQIQAFRHYLETKAKQEAEPPSARVELPDRCKDYPAMYCGLQDETSRIDARGFGANANRWICQGCRFDSAESGNAPAQ